MSETVLTAEVEFICPRCDGRCWATYRKAGVELGYCRGNDDARRSCDFEWPRADDWKIFKLVTVRSFASAEAFRKAMYG